MNGKGGVEKALNDLANEWQLLVGICDADFLHLENKPSPLPNLFLTDAHDLELLMASNDTSFIKFLNEYKPNLGIDIRLKLLESISFLGYLRWYNEINAIGLSFESIDFRKLYNTQTMQLDIQALMLDIIQKSPYAIEKNADILVDDSNNLRNTRHNLLQVCNGHDFMKIIALFVSYFVKKAISDTTATKEFRLVYTITDYKQTNLYKNTQEWAANNHCILYKI